MSSNPVLADLPLFPLHTVLFPGGLLPLKIFEARYLDRDGHPVAALVANRPRAIAGLRRELAALPAVA